MIQATQPPKVSNKRLLVVPFIYAVALAVLAIYMLIGFGGFDFAGIKIETQGTAAGILVVSAAAIFSLPFLLGLKLSPLAQTCSALLAIGLPVIYLVEVIFTRDQTTAPVTMFELTVGAVLGVLAIASFNILKGEESLRLKTKRK